MDEKKTKKAPKGKYTRIDSICDAVRKLKDGEIAKVATTANKLYTAKGGKDNEVESKFATRLVVGGLMNWGVLDGDTRTFKIVG